MDRSGLPGGAASVPGAMQQFYIAVNSRESKLVRHILPGLTALA